MLHMAMLMLRLNFPQIWPSPYRTVGWNILRYNAIIQRQTRKNTGFSLIEGYQMAQKYEVNSDAHLLI